MLISIKVVRNASPYICTGSNTYIPLSFEVFNYDALEVTAMVTNDESIYISYIIEGNFGLTS